MDTLKDIYKIEEPDLRWMHGGIFYGLNGATPEYDSGSTEEETVESI
jgi:hypothetical protein